MERKVDDVGKTTDPGRESANEEEDPGPPPTAIEVAGNRTPPPVGVEDIIAASNRRSIEIDGCVYFTRADQAKNCDSS